MSNLMDAVQKSEMNPGWKGKGVPGLRFLLFSRPKRILLMASRRNISEAVNLLLATLADFWNFHVNPFGRASCLCCGWQGKAFTAVANWRAVSYQSCCPQCDSRSRHRGQVRYLQLHVSQFAHRKTLIFAPEKVILNSLMAIQIPGITTTDYNSVDVDLPNEDIQKLSLGAATFELIICNHVLEHVPDDQRAILECARVLKPGGIALFTIPGDFTEATTWVFSELDSNGHFRHYGLDVLDKFQQGFSHVDMIDMSTLATSDEHVRRRDLLFVCRKAENVEHSD